MFSNVNEIVQQLHLAEQGSYKFRIDWTKSSYKSASRAGDPWNYYFADCFDGLHPIDDPVDLPGGVDVACTRQNIITPRLEDKRCDPLLLPRDRHIPHRIIRDYIRLKPHIQSIVDQLFATEFTGYIVGLHIRGAGRTHGGVPELRNRYGEHNLPPLDVVADRVQEVLEKHADARVFLCSDSEEVVNRLAARLGSSVITYPSSRSQFGEMHKIGHPENRGVEFDRYKLGEDVLVEANLLARTNLLVHGNSNVSNFVLCANPELEHIDVPA